VNDTVYADSADLPLRIYYSLMAHCALVITASCYVTLEIVHIIIILIIVIITCNV